MAEYCPSGVTGSYQYSGASDASVVGRKHDSSRDSVTFVTLHRVTLGSAIFFGTSRTKKHDPAIRGRARHVKSWRENQLTLTPYKQNAPERTTPTQRREDCFPGNGRNCHSSFPGRSSWNVFSVSEVVHNSDSVFQSVTIVTTRFLLAAIVPLAPPPAAMHLVFHVAYA